jgi:hypothetical protein
MEQTANHGHRPLSTAKFPESRRQWDAHVATLRHGVRRKACGDRAVQLGLETDARVVMIGPAQLDRKGEGRYA